MAFTSVGGSRFNASGTDSPRSMPLVATWRRSSIDWSPARGYTDAPRPGARSKVTAGSGFASSTARIRSRSAVTDCVVKSARAAMSARFTPAPSRARVILAFTAYG